MLHASHRFHVFIDDIEAETYLGLVDGVVVCTGGSRASVEQQLALIMPQLQALDADAYALVHGYLSLDHTLKVSEAVARADRAFRPLPKARAAICA